MDRRGGGASFMSVEVEKRRERKLMNYGRNSKPDKHEHMLPWYCPTQNTSFKFHLASPSIPRIPVCAITLKRFQGHRKVAYTHT